VIWTQSAMLRPWTAVFAHGHLQISHVFSDGDQGTGRIDWPEASRGDALLQTSPA
jgi:hypothetical protein